MALQIKKNSGPNRIDIQDGVWIEVNQLTRSRIRELIVLADGDNEAYALSSADEAIDNWFGFVDENGHPLDVTPENKLLVIENPVVGALVEREANGLRTIEEKEIKN
jgi:hypothetical protein